MKFILIKERDSNNPYDTTSVEMRFEAEGLEHILEEFASFLRAASFAIDGELAVQEIKTDGPPEEVRAYAYLTKAYVDGGAHTYSVRWFDHAVSSNDYTRAPEFDIKAKRP